MKRPGGSLQEVALDLPQSILPRIGGMATMPSRLPSLLQALPHILAQVDRLFLYLDQYEQVPAELAGMERLVTLLPSKGGRVLGTAGKFWGLQLHREPCLYFCFDDDIVYTDGYVRFMAAALQRHHHRCVVGIHGAVYKARVNSYVRDRTTFHFARPLDCDLVADELGTGTIAFHSHLMAVDPRAWEHPNLADVQFMIEAVRQKVPRICIRRFEGFLRPIEQEQADSLYMQSVRDHSRETRLLQEAKRLYPGFWAKS